LPRIPKIFKFQNAGYIAIARGGRGGSPGLDFPKELYFEKTHLKVLVWQ
jgi:hypothetical protein